MINTIPTRQGFVLTALVLLSLAVIPTYAQPQAKSGSISWQNVTTVEDVWATYPQRLRKLITVLDLNQKGLEAVASHTQAGDTVAAARALITYFRQKNAGLLSEVPDLDPANAFTVAKQLKADTFAINGVIARVPRREDGSLNWQFLGPDQDAEFGYSLNGHKYLVNLVAAWQSTKNEEYVKTFDRLMRDWLLNNPLPAADDSIYQVLASPTLDWRDIGEVIWRDLEAGNRLGVSWPQTFYAFQQSEAFTPATRLLMLAGIAEHAEYIQKYHKKGHNWTTMEMNGLALVGLTFPEFQQADSWATYAMTVMEREIQRQVYSDGVQTELSTKTQWVALQPFEGMARNFEKSGRTIDPSYRRRLEEMYNYLAYSMRPDGHQPLNNDSDREDLRPRVLEAARVYHRPDWEWIATNGQRSQLPEGVPSRVFPWAGIHIFRSGWDAAAHWTFFDTGPFGTGHQHADMLHLSIAAYGRDLLVDGGRYTHKDYFSFDPTLWRGYFRSTFSHNTLLVDGKGQNGGPVRAQAPQESGKDYLNTPQFDYARGTFSSGYSGVPGKATHTRAVLYVKDKFWVVVDHLGTDRPRQIQALWHYAPSCKVAVEGTSVTSMDLAEGNLRIIPVEQDSWDITLVKGQEQPHIQGWYSADYGLKVPNTTAIYTQAITKPTTFAWVLLPALGQVPDATSRIISQNDQEIQIAVRIGTQKEILVTVPIGEGVPRLME